MHELPLWLRLSVLFLLYLLLFSFKDAEKETHCTALMPGMSKKVLIR